MGSSKNYTYEECLTQDDSPESLSEFEDLYNGEDYSDWICDYYVRIFLPQDKDCDIYVWNEFDVKLSDGRMCRAQHGGYMYLCDDSSEDDCLAWGVKPDGDNFVGPNLLGRLLMELRDNGSLQYTLPQDALSFVSVMKKVKEN